MARSFGIVEDKVIEAEFFFSKLKHADFYEFRFYFSAFLSATRSITYALQTSLSDIEGFTEWYLNHQEELKNCVLAKFFHKARNEALHEATSHINSGRMYVDKDGNMKLEFHFVSLLITKNNTELNIDAITACEEYFKILLNIILNCFVRFGKLIDPEQYWNLKNLRAMGKTIEDIKEDLGYPRGWTNLNGVDENTEIPDEDIVITKDRSPMEPLFIRYLGKNKYGEPVERGSLSG